MAVEGSPISQTHLLSFFELEIRINILAMRKIILEADLREVRDLFGFFEAVIW